LDNQELPNFHQNQRRVNQHDYSETEEGEGQTGLKNLQEKKAREYKK